MDSIVFTFFPIVNTNLAWIDAPNFQRPRPFYPGYPARLGIAYYAKPGWSCLFLFSKKLESIPLFYGLALVFFLQKGHYCVFYLLVVLGGELAVPFTRNPLNAGLNPRPRILYCRFLNHFDRTPRNRRSWTSSDPEGSSDKWRGPCRGSIPVWTVFLGLQKDSTAGAQPSRPGILIWNYI